MTRYDSIGRGYARYRVPDAHIAAHLHAALGNAETVVNVGAGAGSYEPTDRQVTAVEPSATMIAQRPPEAAPAVQASAEALPFEDGAFDATMGVLTLHHWADWRQGLAEMRRVARRVVLLTWDPASDGFWLTQDYIPEFAAMDRRIFPPPEAIVEVLGGGTVTPVPVPADCTDGFLAAYWRRPEHYLDPGARGAISSFARTDGLEPALARLEHDLHSGLWRERYRHLLTQNALDAGYCLIVHSAAGDTPDA